MMLCCFIWFLQDIHGVQWSSKMYVVDEGENEVEVDDTWLLGLVVILHNQSGSEIEKILQD